ncbi:MAG: T9SS type A sorting domain-containing protein, partial [Paludibacter sp.]
RWAAGATYATGVTNAAGRTYLGIGSDNTTIDQNYNNFTEQSLKLFMNEVKRYAPIPAGVNDVKMNNKLVIVKNNCIEMLQSASNVSVINAVGAIVSTHNNVVAGTSISLTHSGMYFVKVKSAQGVEVQKIILQ